MTNININNIVDVEKRIENPFGMQSKLLRNTDDLLPKIFISSVPTSSRFFLPCPGTEGIK